MTTTTQLKMIQNDMSAFLSQLCRTRNLGILFLLGAVFGTAGDICHVASGTLGYPDSRFTVTPFGQPFWVPLIFGGAGLLIGTSHPLIDRFWHPVRSKVTYPRCGIGILLLLALWAASGFLPLPTGGTKDLFLFVFAMLTWLIFDKSWPGLILGGITAVLGTLVEMSLVHAGQFFYLPQSANLFGVPSWLPWLYIVASVAVGNLGRILIARP